jgi:hypothetical protein
VVFARIEFIVYILLGYSKGINALTWDKSFLMLINIWRQIDRYPCEAYSLQGLRRLLCEWICNNLLLDFFAVMSVGETSGRH